MARKTKVNDESINQCRELAKAGFTDKQIWETLNISKSLFYANLELMDTIKKSRNELRQELSKSLLANAVDLKNPTIQIFLAKRLKLFDDTFDSITLNNSKDVLKVTGELFTALANSTISEDKANQLKSILESYMKAYELNNLEERITALESGRDEN